MKRERRRGRGNSKCTWERGRQGREEEGKEGKRKGNHRKGRVYVKKRGKKESERE